MKKKVSRVLVCFALVSAISFVAFAPVNAQAKKGLPLGLAKRYELPPGLAKRKKLPPGLQKKLDKMEKANPRDEPVEKEQVDNEALKDEVEKTIIEIEKKPTDNEKSTETKDERASIKEAAKVKAKKIDKAEKLLYLKIQNICKRLINSFDDLFKLMDKLN